MIEFDENKAIAYMRQAVGRDLSDRYPNDDELFNVIDLIFDYFEANGMLDVDLDDDDDEIDMDDLILYMTRMIRKDKGAKMQPEDLLPFVNAYFDYEESLEDLD